MANKVNIILAAQNKLDAGIRAAMQSLEKMQKSLKGMGVAADFFNFKNVMEGLKSAFDVGTEAFIQWNQVVHEGKDASIAYFDVLTKLPFGIGEAAKAWNEFRDQIAGTSFDPLSWIFGTDDAAASGQRDLEKATERLKAAQKDRSTRGEIPFAFGNASALDRDLHQSEDTRDKLLAGATDPVTQKQIMDAFAAAQDRIRKEHSEKALEAQHKEYEQAKKAAEDRLKQVMDEEQKIEDAKIEAQKRTAATMSELRQQELKNQGKDIEAEIEKIQHAFSERAFDASPLEMDILTKLRNAELDALSIKKEKGTAAKTAGPLEAVQVSSLFTGRAEAQRGSEQLRIAKQSESALKKIDKNTAALVEAFKNRPIPELMGV